MASDGMTKNDGDLPVNLSVGWQEDSPVNLSMDLQECLLVNMSVGWQEDLPVNFSADLDDLVEIFLADLHVKLQVIDEYMLQYMLANIPIDSQIDLRAYL